MRLRRGGLAVVDAPRVMVDNTSGSETLPSTDSEVVSRVGVADDLDVCSPLQSALVNRLQWNPKNVT